MENSLIVIVFLTLVFVVLTLVYEWLSSKKQEYFLEEQIEAALLPYIHSLIVAAFEETFESVETIEERIEALDKAKLAAKIYDLLPETILGYDIAFVQTIFTEEQFLEMFYNAYDSAKEYYVGHKDKFCTLFEDWKA